MGHEKKILKIMKRTKRHIATYTLLILLLANPILALPQTHTWKDIQQEKIHNLKEYKQLESLKDSLTKTTGENLNLSIEREPCDICSKWDLVLRNSKKEYLAFYVIKFKKKNNQIACVTKLKIRNH